MIIDLIRTWYLQITWDLIESKKKKDAIPKK